MPATDPLPDLPEGEAEIKKLADEIGFPVMCKATWGGGGRGMRVIETAEDLISLVEQASREAAAAFGDDPRQFCIETVEFLGNENGALTGLKTVEVDWSRPQENGPPFSRVEGSERLWEADLVFLAMGFLGPEQFIVEELGLETDARSNFQADYGRFTTSLEGVFSAGDCRRGQSLVVWAINEGRGAARECDGFLMGESRLP